MSEAKYYYHISRLGWDGFFGPYPTKEDAINMARVKHITNFYITYGTKIVDFFVI